MEVHNAARNAAAGLILVGRFSVPSSEQDDLLICQSGKGKKEASVCEKIVGKIQHTAVVSILFLGLSMASKVVSITGVDGVNTLSFKIKRQYEQHLNGKHSHFSSYALWY